MLAVWCVLWRSRPFSWSFLDLSLSPSCFFRDMSQRKFFFVVVCCLFFSRFSFCRLPVLFFFRHVCNASFFVLSCGRFLSFLTQRNPFFAVVCCRFFFILSFSRLLLSFTSSGGGVARGFSSWKASTFRSTSTVRRRDLMTAKR